MPQEDPRPPTQNEGTEGQTGPHTGIWGNGGPVVLREVTQGNERMVREVEGDERQGDAQVQMEEHPQLETEATQPEAPADVRQPPEEDPAEMEVQDQEDLTRITEPCPTPGGQEGARKQKPLKQKARRKGPDADRVSIPKDGSRNWEIRLGVL